MSYTAEDAKRDLDALRDGSLTTWVETEDLEPYADRLAAYIDTVTAERDELREAAKWALTQIQFCPCCDYHLEVVTEGIADAESALKTAIAKGAKQ